MVRRTATLEWPCPGAGPALTLALTLAFVFVVWASTDTGVCLRCVGQH